MAELLGMRVKLYPVDTGDYEIIAGPADQALPLPGYESSWARLKWHPTPQPGQDND